MAGSVIPGSPDWQQRHIETYRRTGGQDGHFLDFSGMGGSPETPTLLLETIGRKSGEVRVTPLIYGRQGEEVVIIASRGGAPTHPAWYLNIVEQPEFTVQIMDEKLTGPWRVAEGEERARVWEMMAAVNPLFRGYEGQKAREIPVVMMRPTQTRKA